MAKRSDTPVEERNYSHIYLMFSAALALTTFWAVWDMIKVRSPWQDFQLRFNRLEMEDLQKKYDTAREKFETENKQRYEELQAQLQEAAGALKGAEYAAVLKDSAAAENAAAIARQNYRFAKSEADAIYYEYKEAEYHNDEDNRAKLKKEVDEINAHLVELKAKWDEAETRRAEVAKQLADKRSQVANIEAEMTAMTAEMGNLSTQMQKIDERKIKIEQVVMPDFVRGNFRNFLNNVDRCQSCHVATMRKGFEEWEEPFKTHAGLGGFLKIHEPSRFGCTPCHDGQGPALVSTEVAHGLAKHWEHPLHEKEFVTAGCNNCHASEFRTVGADVLNKGKRMVFDLGCYGCHEIKGLETAERVGPSLYRVGGKLQTNFVYGWLRDNRAFRPHTRMPNPMFSHQEALAVTAFLYSQKQASSFQPVSSRVPSGNVERGRKVINDVGCKGCHVAEEADRGLRTEGLPYDVAPALNTVGLKVTPEWLFDWVKNPKHYSPTTRMPNLRLSDGEAADVVAYITSLSTGAKLPEGYQTTLPDLNDPKLIAEGRALSRNFGCHGCHLIEGTENDSRVSVALNEFGAKTPDDLFYGDMLAKGMEKTWEAWTFGKLQNSRAFATDAVVQRMPNYGFEKEAATPLVVLLESWEGRVIGERYMKPWGARESAVNEGRLLAQKLNCMGCHVLENEGAFIRPLIEKALTDEGMASTSTFAFFPPDITREGEKVQSQWLFNFLKTPKTGEIRPWLRARMPTFDLTDDEANTLVAYFKAYSKDNVSFTHMPNFQLTSQHRSAAQTLVSRDYFSCFSCHQQGSRKPEGPPEGWAPDLEMAKNRLDPDWIAKWIRDPQGFQPGTNMPSFYPDAVPDDVLEGKADEQILALRNYLMNL